MLERSSCRDSGIDGPEKVLPEIPCGKGTGLSALIRQGPNGSWDIDASDDDFRLFMKRAEPRLRKAFVAAYGPERGREATAEALAYGWEHWERLRGTDNVTGYLYRVGQSRTRRKKQALLFARTEPPEPWYEPALAPALSMLTESQRTAVVLVHGFGWTMAEVAEMTGIKVTSVQNHLDRGLKKLRAALKVTTDV